METNGKSNPNNFPGTGGKKKVILAYSGGLDTTTIIPWLKENGDYDVIAVCINVGQGGDELNGLIEKALATGASQCFVEDLTEEFVTDYIWPTLKASAVYEGKYLLGTSMARPLIAKRLSEIAIREGAHAICHGATGKGNDQVRFELGVKAFAPHLEIIAPWRMWDLQSREDEVAYLEARNIPVPTKKDDSYSRDCNLWHMSHEGLDLEDPANEPNYDKLLKLGINPENAPDTPEYIELTFEKGIPTALNGKALGPIEMITELNAIGGKHGIGIIDIVENRLVGIKSRGVYENPAGSLLFAAHDELERLCLERLTLSYKQQIALKYAELVYNGDWFCPLREALAAFVDVTQETVSGNVKLKLYKGNIIPAGVTSPYTMYDDSLASFTTGELFDHKDAEGFINLYGLSTKVRALMMQQHQGQNVSATAPAQSAAPQEVSLT
ncbi:MAG: argininosuccinate synthase [Vampirovibrio sp.]|nr:argininosuccinate synthase [Vampirovibrio sp.]